jgi:hypothetical protein
MQRCGGHQRAEHGRGTAGSPAQRRGHRRRATLSQASSAGVVRLLGAMVTTLLGGVFADAGGQLLRELGEVAVTRNPPPATRVLGWPSERRQL